MCCHCWAVCLRSEGLIVVSPSGNTPQWQPLPPLSAGSLRKDLYTASHWHIICLQRMLRPSQKNSWQMICLEPMWRLVQREFLTDDMSGTYVKIFAQRVPDTWFACNNIQIFAQRVPDRWFVWNLCYEIYTKKYWHMICLHHMLRSLHTEFLTDDLFGTYVKTCTKRIPDRWYVWNICEDLCTESSWHMICL